MYIQHATGSFEVEVGGEWHCGPDHTTPKTLTYDVRIQYPDTALDRHGFLIDNLEFRTYFDNVRYTEDSCELLAKKSADHFTALAPQCYKVQVDICVPGLADIEFDEEPTKPLEVYR